jgi:hypothetical protein
MNKLKIINNKWLISSIVFFTIVYIVFFFIDFSPELVLYFGISFFLLCLIFDYKVTYIDAHKIKIKYVLFFRNKVIKKEEIDKFLLLVKVSGRDSGYWFYLKSTKYKSKIPIKQWISAKESEKVIKKLEEFNYKVELIDVKIMDGKYVS